MPQASIECTARLSSSRDVAHPLLVPILALGALCGCAALPMAMISAEALAPDPREAAAAQMRADMERRRQQEEAERRRQREADARRAWDSSAQAPQEPAPPHRAVVILKESPADESPTAEGVSSVQIVQTAQEPAQASAKPANIALPTPATKIDHPGPLGLKWGQRALEVFPFMAQRFEVVEAGLGSEVLDGVRFKFHKFFGTVAGMPTYVTVYFCHDKVCMVELRPKVGVDGDGPGMRAEIERKYGKPTGRIPESDSDGWLFKNDVQLSIDTAGVCLFQKLGWVQREMKKPETEL